MKIIPVPHFDQISRSDVNPRTVSIFSSAGFTTTTNTMRLSKRRNLHIPTQSEEPDRFCGVSRSSAATLPNSYLKKIIDTFREPHPDGLYDLSTIPNPNGDGNIIFNTIDTQTMKPDLPTLHGRAAAVVASVIRTETRPVVLPRNDKLEPREGMATIIHTIFDRLKNDENNRAKISIVFMDTSYDLRLAVVGFKMPHCKIILSFCYLDVHHIEDPISEGGRLLHLQVQNIFASPQLTPRLTLLPYLNKCAYTNHRYPLICFSRRQFAPTPILTPPPPLLTSMFRIIRTSPTNGATTSAPPSLPTTPPVILRRVSRRSRSSNTDAATPSEDCAGQ